MTTPSADSTADALAWSLDAVSLGIAMLDAEGTVTLWNQAAAELTLALLRDRCGRCGAQRRQHTFDAPTRCKRISEREAGCDETHDLLITRRLVVVDEVDRISAAGRLSVATSE